MQFIKTLTILSLLLLEILSIPIKAQQEPLKRYEYTQIHMGMQARIVLYAPDLEIAERATIAAFHRFAELEDILSDYRPSSELMRLCQKAGGSPVPISPELFLVLEKAQEVSAKSNGAFDVTVSPLVRLWRKARKTGVLPLQKEIDAAKKLVGWKYLKLDKAHQTAQLLKPKMLLDLGGIAKGYACDEAILALKKNGVTHALVEAGGDIAVSEPPPGQLGWRIEVEHPDPKSEFRLLTVSNCGVSTSGDTMQFVDIEGKRYSHIVDPKTGYGLTTHIAVTVIAPRGLLSDALSTTLSVVGAERGKQIAKTYPGVTVSIRRVIDLQPSSSDTDEGDLLRDSSSFPRL